MDGASMICTRLFFFKGRWYCSIESSYGGGVIEIFTASDGVIAAGNEVWLYLGKLRSLEHLYKVRDRP